jgi:hypothetical protein
MTQTVTIKEPQAPASDKQISFLTTLLKERECPSVEEKVRFAKSIGLTKGVASKLIDEALKAPKKPYQFKASDLKVAEEAAAVAAAKPVEAPKLTELPAFGYYWIEDSSTGKDVLYYWDVTGKDQFPTLRRLMVVPTWDGGHKGSWSKVHGSYYNNPKIQATWIPYAGKGYNKSEITKTISVPTVLANAVMAGLKPLSADAAGKLGKQFGFCVRCGATLTDPISVANGLGPVCAKYWA